MQELHPLEVAPLAEAAPCVDVVVPVYNAAIMAVIFLVIGAKVLGQGIAG